MNTTPTRKVQRQTEQRQALRPTLRDCNTCGTPHRTKDGHQACVHHISGGYDRTDQAGRGCKNAPRLGQLVCGKHGGTSKRHAAAGQRRIAELKATALAARWGVSIDVGPTEGILEQIKASAGHIQFYKLQVNALTNNEFVWGQTRRKVGGDDRGETWEAAVNAWVKLYDAERERFVKFCAEAIKAGIEERKVRLAEQQGSLVADVIKRILNDLNLSAEQLAGVPEIVPRHLRLLTA